VNEEPTMIRAIGWSCLLGLAIGCGGDYDATATGLVTLDGTPLPRGTIKFNPMAEGPASYGLVQPDGSYAIRTGRVIGLPSGEYLITVVANEPSAAYDPTTGVPPQPGKPLTPPWYRSPDASPLRQRVESGANKIDVSLSSTPPPDWHPRRGGGSG
jgi:hypothetical protein